ncbi:LlaJI family restriction endonuclease [Enterobacter mori]|uniref:LlaJI family restriction endonuclease n=1 Tax=Enterobacter mori TaxID=539813 RepID=UPI002B201DE3|nr:LlaJI family restriction endonuclease [Enterobacter mori]MEA5207469.1 LlaJI family restriction endonuclease [Enterobacter mori]
MEIKFYQDRCLISSLPEHVKHDLNAYSLILEENSKLDFCGLIIDKEKTSIFLPRNSNFNIQNFKALGSSLIKAIYKYAQNRERFSLRDGYSDRLIGDSYLSLAFTLLKDFVENGLYICHKYEIKRNQGKICWKRTINQIQSFPSGNSLIYLDTIGKKKNISLDSEITRIHARIIRELDDVIGWIYFNDDSRIQHELADINLPENSDEAQIDCIERELNNVYSDRDINLLKDLVRFLTLKNNTSNNNIVIGINKFHSMWESMIDNCLISKFDINNLLAKPCYKINGQYQIASQKGGRTDTVLKAQDHDIFAIIDAKYYGARELAQLPGWPDIIKQFFYALALRDIFPSAQINNYFLFPGDSNNVESVHLQDPKTGLIQDEKYPPIKCIYIEPMHLIDHYVTGKKLTHLSKELLAD